MREASEPGFGLARVAVRRGVAVLGVGWTGERWLTRRCRSGEVLAVLATGGAEGFPHPWKNRQAELWILLQR